jgi:hypothetical protein
MRSFVIYTVHPPNSISVLKSKRARLVGHVARMRWRKIHSQSPSENLKGSGYFGELGADESVV